MHESRSETKRSPHSGVHWYIGRVYNLSHAICSHAKGKGEGQVYVMRPKGETVRRGGNPPVKAKADNMPCQHELE